MHQSTRIKMKIMVKPNAIRLVLVAAISLALTSCSDNKQTTSDNIAVKVNGQGIGVAELGSNPEWRTGNPPPRISQPAMRRIVDMELLRQAAIESGLDKDEEIRARLASSNRKILGMAYLDKQIAEADKASDAEIKTYYDSNEYRFAKRKQYEFIELSFQPPAGKAEEIKNQLNGIKSVDIFEKWLDTNTIAHSSARSSMTSDQINNEMLEKLKSASIGDAIVMGDDKRMNVIFVQAAEDQPLILEAAKQQISRTIVDEKKVDILEKLFKRVRDNAKIEYVAPYSERGLAPEEEEE
jgi:EpsD family peptidyl-prolyl cis-trans isomerase